MEQGAGRRLLQKDPPVGLRVADNMEETWRHKPLSTREWPVLVIQFAGPQVTSVLGFRGILLSLLAQLRYYYLVSHFWEVDHQSNLFQLYGFPVLNSH